MAREVSVELRAGNDESPMVLQYVYLNDAMVDSRC